METAIYVRVSTEEQAQEGFSIRAQEQKLKDYVRIKDWSIYKIYADEGISGKDITGRPAVKEMITDIKAGHVKNVLVFKIDRLTRSTADLIYLVDLFNANDCEFNSLMESIDTQTASGRMFIKIIGIFAEFERENIIERTRVGVERKVKEGYSLCTSSASFGYDRVKGQKIQTVNPAEAEVVRDIFDRQRADPHRHCTAAESARDIHEARQNMGFRKSQACPRQLQLCGRCASPHKRFQA